MSEEKPLSPRYKKRIESAIRRGLSRSQARGHPKAGETPAGRRPSAAQDRRLLRERDLALSKAMDRIAAGEALTAVAKTEHLSREALRRYVGERAELRIERGRFRIIKDRRRVRFPLYTGGTVRKVILDRDAAVVAGRYMSAVGRALDTNRSHHLAPFVGAGVTDVSGRSHPFETDLAALYALAARGEVSFERIYNPQNEDE